MLKEVCLLSPKGIEYITKQLIIASNAQTVQTASGGTDGNRNQQLTRSIWA